MEKVYKKKEKKEKVSAYAQFQHNNHPITTTLHIATKCHEIMMGTGERAQN